MYFDEKTHLLVKQEFQSNDILGGAGEVMSEAIFSDYEKVADMMVPRKVTLKRDGNEFLSGKVVDFTPSESLPKETFAKP